jgi:hypothetical protein
MATAMRTRRCRHALYVVTEGAGGV